MNKRWWTFPLHTIWHSEALFYSWRLMGEPRQRLEIDRKQFSPCVRVPSFFDSKQTWPRSTKPSPSILLLVPTTSLNHQRYTMSLPLSGLSFLPVPAALVANAVKQKPTKRTCSVAGCTNGVVQGGLCVSHRAKRRMCRFPGCTKSSKTVGMCSKHGNVSLFTAC